MKEFKFNKMNGQLRDQIGVRGLDVLWSKQQTHLWDRRMDFNDESKDPTVCCPDTESIARPSAGSDAGTDDNRPMGPDTGSVMGKTG